MADFTRNQELDCEQIQEHQEKGGPGKGQACCTRQIQTGRQEKDIAQVCAEEEDQASPGEETTAPQETRSDQEGGDETAGQKNCLRTQKIREGGCQSSCWEADSCGQNSRKISSETGR